jgi:3-dehydroquinate dehydratase
MSGIAVIVAAPREISGLPVSAEVAWLADVSRMESVLNEHEAAVLVSDGFDDVASGRLAEVIGQTGRGVIEVRAQRWDGETPSPVSAACRGVISGFGDAGILAAVRLLLSEQD